MQNTSFKVYHGGFLLNACEPLEIDLFWCSHACRTCFANLNEPDRKGNLNQIMSALRRAYDSETLEGYLIRNKYPVAFSNHVDPFATSNTRVKATGENWSMIVLETLVEMGVPVSMQTKGGRGLLEAFNYHTSAIDILPPTAWYISIETLDDGFSRLWAPAAPVASRRIAMVQELISRGHTVTIGINPTVPDWIPDPDGMVKTFAEMGVKGLWTNPLHLSDKQLAKMPQRDKDAMGERLLDMAKPRNRHKYPEIDETLEALRVAALEYGIPTYEGQQGAPTKYFDAYEVFPNRYPVLQEFVNWCWANKQDGDLVTWEEFRDCLLPRLPKGVWSIGQHIGSVSSVAFWGQPQVKAFTDKLKSRYGSANKMSYEDVLRLVWCFKSTVYCPVNLPCFSWLVEKGGGRQLGVSDGPWLLQQRSPEYRQVFDSKGLPIMVFDREAGHSFSKKLPLFSEVA